MRIAIDVSSLRYRKTGLETYTYYLLKALSKIAVDDEFVLVNNSFRRGKAAPISLPAFGDDFKFEVKNPKVSKKLLRALWRYSPYPRIETFLGKLDTYHSPTIDALPSTAARKVLTVHDIYHRKGDFNPPWFTSELMEFFPAEIAKADVVITVSESTKRDIIEEFDTDPDKIKCVYSAAGENMRRITDTAAVGRIKKQFGISRDYMLFLGALGKVKNVVRIVEAYNILRQRQRDTPQLVLAGGKGYGFEEIRAAVTESPYSDDIILPGYVDDAAAPVLMSGALFFVFPSLYEGFGIPVLEAMTCGVPVLTSSVASLPEVAGDAAVMVDPCSVEEIAHSMELLAESPALRAKLVGKGFAQSKRFSWERCAAETLRIYKHDFVTCSAGRKQ